MSATGLSYVAPRRKLAARAIRRSIIRRTIYAPSAGDKTPTVSFCSQRDLIGIEVLCSGTFETEFLQLSRSILLDHLSGNEGSVRGRKIAIDIGANIGTHALFFSSIVDKVYAFEPNPPVALVCRANALAANANNVEVFELGLSDCGGTASLFVPKAGNFGWASLEISDESRPGTTIKLERGDEFILPRLGDNERIVLMKTDVEGHEPSVFRGLLETLRLHRPVVFFESISSAHFLSCKGLLESVGYARFEALEKDWENRSGAGKFLSLLTGKTRIRLQPVDPTTDRFYSSIVARPAAHA